MSLRDWIGLAVGCVLACGPEASTGEPLCEGLENEMHGEPVTVTIRNDGEAPIYLVEQYYCVSSFLTIEDPSGQAVEWRSDGWVISCEDLAGPSPSCGGPACFVETVRIDPGGQYGQSWPGYVHDPKMLDPSCTLNDELGGCGTTCFIERTPTPGTYRFSVEAATELDCGDAACPECENDHGTGACSIYLDNTLGSDRITASAEVAYPGTTSTEIVFE
jgi:hypothetical protein